MVIPRSSARSRSKSRPFFAFAVGGSLVIAASVGAPLSCTQSEVPKAPIKTPAPTTSEAANTAAPQSSEPKKKEPRKTYADAFRRRDFAKAAQLIDEATLEDQKTPELRYARALVALEMSDVEMALRSVDGLEEKWPLFKPEAKEIRLKAAKQSGDLTLLQHFLEDSTKPADLLLLAAAHEQGSSSEKARRLADEVLRLLAKSKSRKRFELRARAHLLKARSFESEGKNREAANEYHWLATEGVTIKIPQGSGKSTPQETKADYGDKMHLADSSRSLSAKERLLRAEAYSKEGQLQHTENELKKLRELPGSNLSKGKESAILAWAIYISRSDYLRASELFSQAASSGGPKRKEYLYYEAKSLARSHQDSLAIGKYEKLSLLGGPFAEHASYHAARLRFIDGQWEAATTTLAHYLKKYGKGSRHGKAVQYDLPVARLAAHQYSKAQKEFRSLIQGEDSPRIRARLMELRAVALLGEKKTLDAASLFRAVINERPLSLPALLAAARLEEMGQSVPEPIQTRAHDKTLRKPALSLSLPEKVWRLSRVGLDVQAESALRLEEKAIRKEYGSRAGEALCKLYGRLHSAKRRFQVAQTAASWSALKVAPTPQNEWQWECIYPSPYNEVVEEESALREVPASFVYSIMRQESAFRPTVVSPAAAVGLMQIIPPTAGRIAKEISAVYEPSLMRAPAINIGYGTYYLRRLLNMFGNRPELAAASYNAGPQALGRWLRAGEALPLDVFLARIPYRETRNYVYRVMGNFARYAYLDDRQELPRLDLRLPVGLKASDDAY